MSDSLIQINEYLDLIFAYGSFWVYLAIFTACFIENLFPPFPGDSFILISGGLVASNRLDLPLCLLIIVCGGMCSVMLLHYLGRRFGRDFFVARDYRVLPAADIFRMEASFQRWGGAILIFSRFVVGARAALALVAGIGHYPTLRMFLYSTISYFLFVGLLMYIGIMLVENFDAIGRMVRTYNLIVWPLLAMLVLLWIVRKVRRPKGNSRP